MVECFIHFGSRAVVKDETGGRDLRMKASYDRHLAIVEDDDIYSERDGGEEEEMGGMMKIASFTAYLFVLFRYMCIF